MLIKYLKVRRSECLSQNCVHPRKNNFLNTGFLYRLTFMWMSFKSRTRLMKQWKFLIPFMWNTVWSDGNFHQGILTSRCLKKQYWQQVWCLLWQALSEGGKQQFRDLMSLRFQLCQIRVNGGLHHEFAEPCLESLPAWGKISNQPRCSAEQ